jgi:2-C-methyl-D-erythritol 2,4-cyclodiphosphate synthase
MADRRRPARRGFEAPVRVGCGFDVHPFGPCRRLVLGGVRVRRDPGLVGHSDADVLAHAVCDALLGAMGLPDMGIRYPASDPRLKGRSSLRFVREIMREARGRGFRLGNLDAVLLAETPRLRPHLPAMRRRLARALGCAARDISVKAKHAEGLGAIGRGEGIAAQAVVLLLRPPSPGGTQR